ncbi:MAG: hypothetical protein K9L76_00105 [Candidatus Omnitrophica bacterium]|nr:hypothetical protein [Candidatus Omnitrophota bacterium]
MKIFDSNFSEVIFNAIQDNAFLRTKKGLLFISISLYVIIFFRLKPFETVLYNNILSIGLIVAYFIFWLYFSGRMFFSSKIKILFAVDYSEEAKKYSAQINKNINSKIDELGLSQSIKIINMPMDFIVPNRIEAERYVKRRMIDLLIWGYTVEGRFQKSKLAEFKLKFTYLYRILPPPAQATLIKHINNNLRGRYWRILEDNSFPDIQVVSTNITEVSLFIIGLCLYVRGKLSKSLKIFENLKATLNNKNETDFPGVENIMKQVDSYLVEGYRFIGEQIRDSDPPTSKNYFKKLLHIQPEDSGAHLNIAKLSYVVDNDLESAKKHTDKVTDPLLTPLKNYNYAFFGILEKDPIKVLQYYKRIRAVPSENIVDIIAFLQDEFSKDKSNILYHFALGYINVYHGDLKIGIEELKSFIEKAKGKFEYKELVDNARPLLKSRKKKLKARKV